MKLATILLITTAILIIALMVGFNQDFRNSMENTEIRWGSFSFTGNCRKDCISKEVLLADHTPNDEVDANYTSNDEVDANYTSNDEVDANYTSNDEVDANYTSNDEVDANYTSNDEVDANYTSNDEVDANYTSNDEVDANYTSNDEVDANYTSNDEVDANYTSNDEVDANYTSNDEVDANYTSNDEVDVNYTSNDEVDANYTSNDEIVSYVRYMKPNIDAAIEIRNIQKDGEGPWTSLPLPESEKLIVSVPGVVEKEKAYVCDEHYGKKYVLYANYDRYPLRKKSVMVEANKHIMSASDCPQETKGYDMQISCADAKIIFPQEIAYCDKVMRISCEEIELAYPNRLEEIKECHKTTNRELIYECNDTMRKYFPDIKCNVDPKWDLNNAPWETDPSHPRNRLKVLAVPVQ